MFSLVCLFHIWSQDDEINQLVKFIFLILCILLHYQLA